MQLLKRRSFLKGGALGALALMVPGQIVWAKSSLKVSELNFFVPLGSPDFDLLLQVLQDSAQFGPAAKALGLTSLKLGDIFRLTRDAERFFLSAPPQPDRQQDRTAMGNLLALTIQADKKQLQMAAHTQVTKANDQFNLEVKLFAPSAPGVVIKLSQEATLVGQLTKESFANEGQAATSALQDVLETGARQIGYLTLLALVAGETTDAKLDPLLVSFGSLGGIALTLERLLAALPS